MFVTVIFDLIDPPVIVTHPPENMNFIVNSSSDRLTLTCTAEGEGVVHWQKDGVDIDGSEMPIVPDGNTLDIAPDEITDTSVVMYRCIASNIAGSFMSDSTSVTVIGEHIICTHTCTNHVLHMCAQYTHAHIHKHTHIFKNLFIMSIIVYYLKCVLVYAFSDTL